MASTLKMSGQSPKKSVNWKEWVERQGPEGRCPVRLVTQEADGGQDLGQKATSAVW